MKRGYRTFVPFGVFSGLPKPLEKDEKHIDYRLRKTTGTAKSLRAAAFLSELSCCTPYSLGGKEE